MDALEKMKKKANRRWLVIMIIVIVLFAIIVLPNQAEGNDIGYYILVLLFAVYFIGKYIIGYKTSKWRTCPKCNEPEGVIFVSVTTKEPTMYEEGKGVHTIRCKKCGHEWKEEYEIPCLAAESSSDDDDKSSRGGGGSSSGDSGSWGGGSSSGGGAGRSI